MTAPTIRQIKQQSQQLAKAACHREIPTFWITDWLLYVLDKPAISLIMDDSYRLSEVEFEQFNTGVSKMQQGTPLAYLTGQQEFWSLNFKVNKHTLIPRPDTEVLVEQVLHWIKTKDKLDAPTAQLNDNTNKRLLDLGTGSGCIAISLAYELMQNSSDKCNQNSWQVVAIDISDEALKVAEHNATINHIKNIEFIKSSWYSELPTDSAQMFDVIVSNPPYIDEADEHLAGLKAEPISALSAADCGLADIKYIIKHAPQYLLTGGLLAIEHGFDQGRAVRQLMSAHGFTAVNTIQDFGGNDRITLAQLS